jgi:hypothetical protein
LRSAFVWSTSGRVHEARRAQSFYRSVPLPQREETVCDLEEASGWDDVGEIRLFSMRSPRCLPAHIWPFASADCSPCQCQCSRERGVPLTGLELKAMSGSRTSCEIILNSLQGLKLCASLNRTRVCSPPRCLSLCSRRGFSTDWKEG